MWLSGAVKQLKRGISAAAMTVMKARMLA